MQRETSLYSPLVAYFKRRGHIVRQEVLPRAGSPRRFDVVALSKSNHELVIVEAKLAKFSRALQQAQRGLHLAEWVYVSFPLSYASFAVDRYAHELASTGIGVLGIGRRVLVLVPPRRSDHVNPDRQATLIATMGLERRAA